MTFIKEYPVLRYVCGKGEQDSDQVLSESSFSLYLNGSLWGTVSCIPDYPEELILGKLYTEGRISSLSDVEDLEVSPALSQAHVAFREQAGQMKRLPDLEVNPLEILNLSQMLLSSSETFNQTGNVHSVMLCRGSRVLYVSEDVDRYHALEKTVGRALKDGVDFTGTTLYTTGRIPCSMAERTIRAGIPAIISRSAPTDLTVDLAKEYNLTVIGFARRNRMNVYHTCAPQAFITM